MSTEGFYESPKWQMNRANEVNDRALDVAFYTPSITLDRRTITINKSHTRVNRTRKKHSSDDTRSLKCTDIVSSRAPVPALFLYKNEHYIMTFPLSEPKKA